MDYSGGLHLQPQHRPCAAGGLDILPGSVRFDDEPSTWTPGAATRPRPPSPQAPSLRPGAPSHEPVMISLYMGWADFQGVNAAGRSSSTTGFAPIPTRSTPPRAPSSSGRPPPPPLAGAARGAAGAEHPEAAALDPRLVVGAVEPRRVDPALRPPRRRDRSARQPAARRSVAAAPRRTASPTPICARCRRSLRRRSGRRRRADRCGT